MDLTDKIRLLPHSPGVYIYYDSEGIVIYVGKAKDLHKRVSQYFVSSDKLNRKTRILVSKIADLQYTILNSESDALLLENNLIKEHKPRYNILLKDSKTYPWICVTNEYFPRVFLTRNISKKSYKYFGPYSSVHHARSLLSLFRELYPIRTCKYRIDEEVIKSAKIRPCLEYHIHKCDAPCVGAISREDYMLYINNVVSILSGDIRTILEFYRTSMLKQAENLEFEKAEQSKKHLLLLENHYSKSLVTTTSQEDMDVFSLVVEQFEAFGNFLRIRSGAIVNSFNLRLQLNIEEDTDSILSTFIAEISRRFGSLSKLVIVPFLPDFQIEGHEFRIPTRGDKLEILKLSFRNAKEFRFNILKQKELTDPNKFYAEVLEELQKILGLPELPCHIECFDNSNIQGTNPVSSCVVFRNGQPSKRDYRRFKVKTVVGANDFASMSEVVYRRYSRMLKENPDDLPQLIVIDGGRGQLSSAVKSLSKLGILDKLSVVGLAKRLEEVIKLDDPHPLFIDRNSQSLKLLQNLRDEAHRFGISFHRDLRSKSQVKSILSGIKGVGPKTRDRLLIHYGSIARISEQSMDKLESFLKNKKLAKTIFEHLHKQ